VRYGDDNFAALGSLHERADAAVRRLIASAQDLARQPFEYRDPLTAPNECDVYAEEK
jgi:hypothetical protein